MSIEGGLGLVLVLISEFSRVVAGPSDCRALARETFRLSGAP